MGRIFLSYAREDRKFAEKLAPVLEQAGHEVWWDRRLDGGEEFSAEIEAALSKADVVLVAWSKSSARSRWVRDEASVGVDAGQLVPVTIDGSQPPMGFRQFHTIDLSGWKAGKRDKRTAELLHSVERRLTGEPRSRNERVTRRSSPRLQWTGAKPMRAMAAALVLIILLGGIFLFGGREQRRQRPLKPTIAVLPFAQSSPDPELRELGSQARDALANSFSQSGLPVRLLDSIPQEGESGADFLIFGEFSRNAGKVTANLRLDEAAHGVTVFSRRFDANGEGTRDLPERIGAQMAGNLTWQAPLMVLDRRRPLDPTLVADLLHALDFTGDPLQAYQNTRRAAAKAPSFAITQISLAFNTSFVLDQIPLADRPEAVALARNAGDRAMELQPDFGDTHGVWCLLHSGALLGTCEDRLRAGRLSNPDSPFLDSFLSYILRSVGRFDESVELARLSYTHDIYVPTKIGWMLRMLEYAGEDQQARELNANGVRWWPEYQADFFRQRLWGLIDRGDFPAIQRLEREMGAKNLPAGYVQSEGLVAALKSSSLPQARESCRASDNFAANVRCMIVLSRLGGENEAYAIAEKLYRRRVGRTAIETDRIWLEDPSGEAPLEFITGPAASAMRRDPRYLQLAERTGLLDYWRSGRRPDFCRMPRPEPVCAQLLKRS